MTYSELIRLLQSKEFSRVERDDRLLDIFPAEDREKGIELWEKWLGKKVRILRVKLPFAEKKLQLFLISRPELEQCLYTNQVKQLDSYPPEVQESKVIVSLS
jgi:hypothetical protein